MGAPLLSDIEAALEFVEVQRRFISAVAGSSNPNL
jgi:hypothetical protein